MSDKDLPLRKNMCPTCPFRKGSPYEYLKRDLAISTHSVSRICHSTGSNNAINRRTGLPRHICRGARDVQLDLLHKLGFIDAPTDEAWNATRVKYGLKPQVIQDPVKEKRK